MRLILGLGAFGFGGGGLPKGSAISRLFTICGVVMMKITSSTNTRSSSGVMFNSFMVLWPRREVFFISRLDGFGLHHIKTHEHARRKIRRRRTIHTARHRERLADGIVPTLVVRTFFPDGIADL